MKSGDRTAATLIQTLRESSGFSQSELARRAGITRSVLNAYERGTRQPGVDALARLAAAAGMQLELTARANTIDPSRAGKILAQVLDLAEALPFRARPTLTFPPLLPE